MSSKIPPVANNDYQDFLVNEEVAPPLALTEKILAQVSHALNPSAWQVFAKLALIHFVTGLGTLAICPQFGIRTLGDGMGLMSTFAAFGTYGCMIACGAFFVGSSLFIAGQLLKPEEVKVLKRHGLLQLAAITFLSLGTLLMADAEILFGFALAWFLGSVAGGFALLEASWYLRRQVLAS